MKFFITITVLLISGLSTAQSMTCVNLLNTPLVFKDHPSFYHKYAISKGFIEKEINPKRGWLKDFNVKVPPLIQAKLKTKHKIEIEIVLKAFERWNEGPVEVDEFSKIKMSDNYLDSTRYYFVTKIKSDFEKTGISDYVKAAISFSEEGEITLVSAFYASTQQYIQFINSPKALD